MTNRKPLEIRGFMNLDAFLRKKFGSMPFNFDIEEPMTGIDLAGKLGISINEVEVIFVNGFVHSLDYLVNPGDRIAFLPPGCPGPHKIALGFYNKNKKEEANLKIKDNL